MIEPSGFRARCDQVGCGAVMVRATLAVLLADADAVGWTFNRRTDGQPASRNGRDYCPVHKRRWHLLDNLTENMAARLVALLQEPNWRPRGAGQFHSARLMYDRGLLSRWTGEGGERYTLNDEGRRAALDVKGRRDETVVAIGHNDATSDDAQGEEVVGGD